LTEIYHLLGMKSSRDDLIDRMKTGWGCFVLASKLVARLAGMAVAARWFRIQSPNF
jgi:hypothetical protein